MGMIDQSNEPVGQHGLTARLWNGKGQPPPMRPYNGPSCSCRAWEIWLGMDAAAPHRAESLLMSALGVAERIMEVIDRKYPAKP
jgi:hypothetical protein